MKISINRKIIGLFLAGVVIFAIFASSTFLVIKDNQKAVYKANIISKKVNLTGDLQVQVNRLLLPVNYYLIAGDIKERDNFDSIIGEMSKIFADLKTFSGDKRWQAVAEKVEKDVIDFGEKAINILYIDNPVRNKEAQELMTELILLSDILVKEVDRFHGIAEDEIKKMEEDVNRGTMRSNIYALIILCALVLLALLLYYYLKNFITVPLHRLHEGADIIAKGDLQYRLNIKTGDELEELAGAFNDMTSSLGEARKELDRRIFELYMLYNVSKVLSTTFEVEELFTKIVNHVSKGLNIDEIVLFLIDNETDELYIGSYTGVVGKEMEKKRFKIGEGFFGSLARSGKARLVADIEKDESTAIDAKLCPGVNSIIAVPFGTRERVIGMLTLFKNKPYFFYERELLLIESVAEHVVLALENARLYNETKLLSITDGLTELYNHRFFVQRLDTEVKRSKRYKRPLSLIMLDIDYFKNYNDANGHLMGDMLLKKISELIKTGLRSTDFAARYGGEEFVLILSETDKRDALYLAERIRKTISEYPFPCKESQPGSNLTVSLGVASLHADASDADEIIKKADDALYRAKETGRNRVVAA